MTAFSSAERDFLRLVADGWVGHGGLAAFAVADLDWGCVVTAAEEQ